MSSNIFKYESVQKAFKLDANDAGDMQLVPLCQLQILVRTFWFTFFFVYYIAYYDDYVNRQNDTCFDIFTIFIKMCNSKKCHCNSLINLNVMKDLLNVKMDI